MQFTLEKSIASQVEKLLEKELGPYWAGKLARCFDRTTVDIVDEFKNDWIGTVTAVLLEKNWPEVFDAEAIMVAQAERHVQQTRERAGLPLSRTEAESFYTESRTYSFSMPEIPAVFTISNILAGDDGEGEEFVNFDLSCGEDPNYGKPVVMACVLEEKAGQKQIRPIKNNSFDYFFSHGTAEKVFREILKMGFPG